MKILVALISCTFIFTSCSNKQEKAVSTDVKNDTVKASKFEMYEMSEMAALMEQMYAYNTQLKERIINKDSLGTYPEAFDKLHSAILTEASDRDAFFNDQAIKFIESQKMIYTDVDNAEKHFNAMVNQCLECHTKKCGGPIPRIKKLIIN